MYPCNILCVNDAARTVTQEQTDMGFLQETYNKARSKKHAADDRYNGLVGLRSFQENGFQQLVCDFKMAGAYITAISAEIASHGIEKISKFTGQPVVKDNRL